MTCHHPLLVHTDATVECEGAPACGADELVHDWVLPCHEVGCRCALALAA